jgi:hypothetical protein
MLLANRCAVVGMEKIPDQDERVVTTRRQHSSSQRIPFYTVHRCRVSAQLKKGLPRLPDIEDADEVRVGGKRSE